jgi:cell division septation protein DedD
MADRRSPGLTFGQLITLTFGFLLASVVIFVFGLWVGRDLAEQQAAKQRDVARMPVEPPPPAPTKLAAAAAPTRAEMAAATRPPALAVAPTATPVRASSATAVVVVRAASTPTRFAAAATPAANGGWTVQAYATNDTVRAVMLARTLRSKGYDASTATRQIGGTTWYLVRVGRYRDRSAAKQMESKLRSEEGLEAASVTAQ